MNYGVFHNFEFMNLQVKYMCFKALYSVIPNQASEKEKGTYCRNGHEMCMKSNT